MALTIVYDGIGVIANADALTDTAGGTWSELGGGTIVSNPDVYLYGSSSIGSKYASKSGYSYFTKTTPINFNTTALGQFIYMWINISSAGAFDVMSTLPFNIIIGDATGSSYEYTIASKGDANGWTGGWKLFCIDISTATPTVTNGTPDLTAIDTFGVWIDTNVSVRADSVWLSQIIVAKGLKVTGSPTIIGGGFNEVVTWCTDYTNRAAGMFQKRGNTYYSLGQLTIGDAGQTAITNFTSSGNLIEYEASESWNGSAWVTMMSPTINNIISAESGSFTTTISYQDTSISGFIDNKLSINTSGGTSTSFDGGSLKYLRNITVISGDTFNGTVFNLNDALSLGNASYNNCTFNDSGTLSIISGTTFTNNIIKTSAGVTGVNTADLDYLSDCSFISPSTGYAIELTSLGDGSMNWTNFLTDYASVDGSTGNEALYVNVGSGNLTLNILSGYNTPSVRTAGAVITKVIAPVTTTITIQSVSTGLPILNARVILVANSGGDENYQESITITNISTTATVTHTSHGLSTGDKVNILGAEQSEYNGVKQITVTTANAYTFVTANSPTSPATGIITSTTVFIDGTADALGEIEFTRSLTTNQPVIGRSRRATTGDLYKTAPITATVDSGAGLNLTVQMIPDE